MRVIATILLVLSSLTPRVSFLSQISSTLLITGIGAFPTPPANAYTYANLETEDSACPSYVDATTQAAKLNCWVADSVDATGAAGAGIATPTLLRFGISSPSLSPSGSMQSSVSNSPPAVTQATGNAGDSFIVVTKNTGIPNGATLTGSGIGANALVASSWDRVSTTVPLTVPNSGAVNGNVTFSNTFVSNSLFYRNLPYVSPPSPLADVTSGTLTIHAGTITVSGNNLVFTNMTATDTVATVTTLQVYVDDSASPVYNNAADATHSPASFSTLLADGPHTYAVKAFSNNGNSAVTARGTVSLGGAPSTPTNIISKIRTYFASGNDAQAYEYDPNIFYGGYQYVASLQCRIHGDNAGQWFFWNSWSGGSVAGKSSGNGPYGNWVLQPGFTYPCPTPAANVWHTQELYVTYDLNLHTYQYQTFMYDGKVIFHNLGLQYNASPGHVDPATGTPYPALLNVQHQIDATSTTPRTGPGITEYFSDYSLITWVPN